MANDLDIYECEVRRFQTDPATGQRRLMWVKMRVPKAMQLGDDPETRCLECHGPVRLHRAGPNGVPAAHAEHRTKHSGCSLGFCFEGTKSLHPDALN
jgi:hypothetical protein